MVTPKPTCLFQHVQIASLHSGEKKSQAVTGFIKGNLWLGQGPADPAAEGSGWAASSVRGREEEGDAAARAGPKAERRGRPLPLAREAAFHSHGPVDMPEGGIGTGLSVLAYQLCDFGPVT